MSIFNRKKKQSTEDRFLELFSNAMDAATANAQKQTPTLLKNQHVWKSNYGLDKSNPIISDSLAGTDTYLSRLCTLDGKTFTWSGYTSIRAAVHGLPDVGEDKYTLYLDGQPYTDIYFVPYVGTAEFPPAGLCFTDDKRDWSEERHAAKYADEMGITRNVAKQLLEAEARELDSANKKKKEAEKEISIVYPEVNIDDEFKRPLFKTLYEMNINPVIAYEYVHSAQLLTRKKQYSLEESNAQNVNYYHQVFFNLYREEFDQLNNYTKGNEEAKARELQVSLDVYRRLEAADLAERKEKWKVRESQINELSKQAVELKKRYPTFNIEKEIQNEQFVKLIDKISLQEAFEIVHFSDCFERANTEAVTVVDNNQKDVTGAKPLTTPGKDTINVKLFCRNCGKQIPSDSFFCPYCGTKVII